jgi:thiamine biosynthesis lipoprotein
MEFPGKNNKKLVFVILILIVVGFGLYLRGSQNKYTGIYSKTEFFMDTKVLIKVPNRAGVEQDVKNAFKEMKYWAGKLNRHNRESVINKINKSSQSVEVSQEIFSLIETCIRYSAISKGSFDPTITPLLDIWGFGKGKYRIPSVQEVNDNLPLVNYRKIKLDSKEDRVYLPQSMSIDLGGAAKGFIVDKGLTKLKQMSYKSIYINAGGNIRVEEKNIPEERLWKIGIRKPENANQIFEKYIVGLSTGSLATSGNYERYFTRNGKRYSHLINPRTGYQVRDLKSVTIYGPTALQADIFSTAIFVMGWDDGRNFIKNFPKIEGFLVNDNEIWISDGFNEILY